MVENRADLTHKKYEVVDSSFYSSYDQGKSKPSTRQAIKPGTICSAITYLILRKKITL